LSSHAITFSPSTTVNYGDVIDLSLSASGGGSGNPVTFSISNISPSGIANLSGTNNSTLTITGVGTFTITANQAGGSDGSTIYADATSVLVGFTATARPLSISGTSIAAKTYDGSATSGTVTPGIV